MVSNDMSRMIGLIRTLLPLRVDDQELREVITKWADAAQRAYGRRGEVIHSVWIGDRGPGPHFKADLKKLGSSIEDRTRTVEDFLALARELDALITAPGAFLRQLINAAPGPWSAGDP